MAKPLLVMFAMLDSSSVMVSIRKLALALTLAHSARQLLISHWLGVHTSYYWTHLFMLLHLLVEDALLFVLATLVLWSGGSECVWCVRVRRVRTWFVCVCVWVQVGRRQTKGCVVVDANNHNHHHHQIQEQWRQHY